VKTVGKRFLKSVFLFCRRRDFALTARLTKSVRQAELA
jgi:hypothetical protein